MSPTARRRPSGAGGRWAAGLCWLGCLAACGGMAVAAAAPGGLTARGVAAAAAVLTGAGLGVGGWLARRRPGCRQALGAAGTPAAWYGLWLTWAGGLALWGAGLRALALVAALAALGGLLEAVWRWCRRRLGDQAEASPLQGSRAGPAPWVLWADRVADWWGAAWSALAVLTLAALPWWGVSLDRALAAALWPLALAWPGAWALATRLPVTAALAAARRRGCLVAGGAALARLAALRRVAFPPGALSATEGLSPRLARLGLAVVPQLGGTAGAQVVVGEQPPAADSGLVIWCAGSLPPAEEVAAQPPVVLPELSQLPGLVSLARRARLAVWVGLAWVLAVKGLLVVAWQRGYPLWVEPLLEALLVAATLWRAGRLQRRWVRSRRRRRPAARRAAGGRRQSLPGLAPPGYNGG